MDKDQKIRMWSMLISGVIYGNKPVEFKTVIDLGIPELIRNYIENGDYPKPEDFDLE